MSYTLYGYDGNPRSQIVRVVAAAEGIPLQHITVNPRMNIGTQEYIAKFPFTRGKIPALEGPNIKLTEVLAISWYLASLRQTSKLLGNGSPEQAAEVHSWCSWANQEFQTTLSQWFLPLIPGYTRPAPYNYDAVEKGKTASLQILDLLDQHLGGRKFLVGDTLTLADVFIAIDLQRPFRWVLGKKWRDDHPNTVEYFNRVMGVEWFGQASVKDFAWIEEETPNQDPYGDEGTQMPRHP